VKVISWNLLRRTGAAVEDVAALIEREQPQLLLMQEATRDIDILGALAGGYLYRSPLPARIHGLAVWSPHLLPPPAILPLPISALPGRVPPRIAQIVQHDGITFANLHLSHGQFLNRWQIMHVAAAIEGPAAIIGDFNAVGPTFIPGLGDSGFRDVGPREHTHRSGNVVPVRLDRCLVRGLHCAGARALDRGPSDHRPIVLHLGPGADRGEGRREATRRRFIAQRIERLRERTERSVRARTTA
jgi:endonuclease/exonuclease/phosphatase (EEP) superfamily protein YafD